MKASWSPSSQPIQALQGTRLLLVDDSVDNQRLFFRVLRFHGACVDIAQNGLEAIQMHMHRDYDAILMDICMPVLDGYQATSRIRELGFAGPIIALTAQVLPGEEQRCRDSGCSHFLTKPVDRGALIDTLAAFFR